MWKSPFSASRECRTETPCPACGAGLIARRGCREVRLHCESCTKIYAPEDVAPVMDEALEDFLENVFCDRM